jgi:CelD/BcsL family acetyltransferase involved in cellulose biosynthesis
MLKIELVNMYDKFLKLEPIWNDMLAKSDIDIPFMTFEWFGLWWKRYGSDKEMIILVVRDGSECVAIAPMMRKKMFWRCLPVTVISFIANYLSMRTGMIVAKEHKDLWETILNFTRLNYKFDLFYFDFVVKDSMTGKLLNNASQSLRSIQMTGELSPYVDINGSWEDYINKRSKKLLKNLKHRNKLIISEGGYAITEYSNSEISKAMEELLTVSRKSTQFKQRTAIANKEDLIEFYRSFSDLTSNLGWLRISIIKFKDVPIAFQYKLKYKDVTYSLKKGYNSEYYKYSPGIMLLHNSIKTAFADGSREYDLLGLNEPHKMEWTSTVREHRKYWIFNNTRYGNFLYLWEKILVSNIKKILFLKRNR